MSRWKMHFFQPLQEFIILDGGVGEKKYLKQECIPVGCVPPAAVAVRGGLHQAPPRDQAPSPCEQNDKQV